MTPPPHAKHTKHDIPSPALSPVQPVAASPAVQRHELDIPKPAPVTRFYCLSNRLIFLVLLHSLQMRTNKQTLANNLLQCYLHMTSRTSLYLLLLLLFVFIQFKLLCCTVRSCCASYSQNSCHSWISIAIVECQPIDCASVSSSCITYQTYCYCSWWKLFRYGLWRMKLTMIACSTQSKVLLFNVQPNFTLEATHTLTEHTAEVNDIKLFKVKEKYIQLIHITYSLAGTLSPAVMTKLLLFQTSREESELCSTLATKDLWQPLQQVHKVEWSSSAQAARYAEDNIDCWFS